MVLSDTLSDLDKLNMASTVSTSYVHQKFTWHAHMQFKDKSIKGIKMLSDTLSDLVKINHGEYSKYHGWAWWGRWRCLRASWSPVAKIFIAKMYFWAPFTSYFRSIISVGELHNGCCKFLATRPHPWRIAQWLLQILGNKATPLKTIWCNGPRPTIQFAQHCMFKV